MANFLVIGGSGVMGTAAIQAVRKFFGKEANIVANWYGKEDTGLKISAIQAHGPICRPDVHGDFLKQAIRFAAECGAL
ncbi:MAG: hypothetical protein MJD61_00410, partial [Proteobacteria bacterium]|nr:hypothetical protein [Pseudomonadota bacterium]